MRKLMSIMLVVSVLFTMFIFTGCTASQGEASEASQSTGTESNDKEEAKFVWYASAPHPYFEEVQNGVEAFEEEYGIEVTKQIGADWTQAAQNNGIEALVAKGNTYFSVYPSDVNGANALYDEITARGVTVVNFGASTAQPTNAEFYVGTDIKQSAMEATEALIEMMGGEGKIINVLEVLEDSNTVLRKEGVEEVVAKYPDVEIVQEISGMKSTEEAIEKIGNSITANIDEVDGIIATGFTTSVGLAQTLEDFYAKNPDKKLCSIGIDTDPTLMKAIENDILDATVAQNPYGHGYLSMVLLNYLAEGYVPIEGVYNIDAGTVIVTKDNLDTYEDDITAKTEMIKSELEEKYFEKK